VQTALVFRHIEALNANDEALLRAFADEHKVTVYLQPKGPETVHLLHPADAEPLYYTLPEFGLKMQFWPIDFTQVNHGINRMLLRRAMKLLDPQPGERIADMFCGIGNFTLPIARSGATVVGVEGSKALVDRALLNAELNGLAERTEFGVSNLFEATEESLAALGHFDRMLIDPPREGAAELCKALGADAPRRIVYVSCSPATLARDAAILVHEKGYVLKGAGIANMFPQTSHVESIALFERN
jgi:23S rRNA (uracil1939-C5)-methyltransferase